MSPIVASMCLPQLPAESVKVLSEKVPRYAVAMTPSGNNLWVGGELLPPLTRPLSSSMLTNHLVHAQYANTPPGEGIHMVILAWKSDKDPSKLQGAAILPDIKERASEFADPFKQALLSIPDDTRCFHNRLSYWPTEPWDNRNGTVTLAGDAAHPMTFRT
jgi:2-polyprenyl-6-methoxyphenol hydroxylase-like FAD-dependent oxidoreductase